MRFKKLIAAVSAAAVSLSMLAAVNVNAEEAEDIMVGGDPSSRPYYFEYDITPDGAVIKSVSAAAGIREVEIPEKTDAGITVVGVEDFAFEYADVDTVIVPDTFKLGSIGDAAFLSNADIAASVSAFGSSEEEALGFAANTVKFMGKKNWKGSEEELSAAKEVLGNVLDTMGFTGSAHADSDGITAEQAAMAVSRLYKAESLGEKSFYVREDGVDDITKMSERSYDNFTAWVKLIPVNVTLKGTKGSAGEEYANGKTLIGVKFEENETHLIGDANQDGKINVRDCATIARAMAEKSKYSELIKCEICADYNGDGAVNVRDAAQLANAIATGKIDTSGN